MHRVVGGVAVAFGGILAACGGGSADGWVSVGTGDTYGEWELFAEADDGKWTWKFDSRFRAPDAGIRVGRDETNDDRWQTFRDVQAPALLVRGTESDVLTQDTAERMLDEGVYSAACSDSHRAGDVELVASAIERLSRLAGKDETVFLLSEGPRRILDGTIDT